MEKKKWDLFALASIPLAMTLGNSMFIPVLPVIEKEIGISAFQSSLIITVYSIIAILLIPIAGYLSDRIGRKKVIIPSLIISAIGGIVSTWAAWRGEDPFMLILVGRFLQGAGAAGAFPVVIPTVGDMFKDEKEMSHSLGIIETSNTFGKVLSPIFGAVLAAWIWYLPFASVPVLSVISLLLILKFVKVPKDNEESKKKSIRDFIDEMKETFHHNGRWLTAVFIIGCLNMFILFSFLFHLSSLLEDDYDITGVVKGVVLAVPLLFLCISSYICGKKIGGKKTVMRSVILISNGGGAAALAFINKDLGLFLMILLLTITSIGIGLSLPCLDTLITAGIAKEERGTITSFYSSMRFLGVAAGPPVTALLLENNFNHIYLIFAALSMIAALLAFWAIKPEKKVEEVLAQS
ncbi:MFS transporter [Oceanobacillus sp. 143]|uniref:MFS transporter n=1 Tax=Oceanobacillus zhaokaii TaxID=2052660 RepID=A0A345PDM8_9BACI|nr:MFS transporter [Oceanobacillus zhaokaii]AXI08108.1 MFS transporter [Oceanobacillus zhaokaii]QGS68072.1 MFS transporter [Oceanobacillus sp. 143]